MITYTYFQLILDLINGDEIKQFNNFKFSRYQNTTHLDWERQFLTQLKKYEPDYVQQELIFN